MHPWALIGRGTGGGGGGASRRYFYKPVSRLRRLTNECRLEEEQNTRDFPLFKPKSGGDISYVVPTKLKSGGGTRPPPIPHRSTPMARNTQSLTAWKP